jgi:superoxide reductase
MPHIFKAVDISKEEKELRKDFFDRHAPVIICDNLARRGEKFKIKVRVGTHYQHPDEADHFVSFVQLWNHETLLAQTQFGPGILGNQASQIEVDYYIIPKNSLLLTAMSNCTKHGLWQSEAKEVKVIHSNSETGN